LHAAGILLAWAACAIAAGGAGAATTAGVTVDADTTTATLSNVAYGVNGAVWDPGFETTLPAILKPADVTLFRYPGGSYGDMYHWATNTNTDFTSAYSPYTGDGWVDSRDDFDNYMHNWVIPSGGKCIVIANYGSDAAGNGGDPKEAAGWVKYANVTKKYGVKYWEIGNEIYGNGYYATYWDWEWDLHDTDTNPSDRVGNANLGPSAYGANVVQYAKAMKAVDPTVKVGAVLAPIDSFGWHSSLGDWDSEVLKQCGPDIGFVILHWYPGGDDAAMLSSSDGIAAQVSGIRSLIDQYCGKNADKVEILVTETSEYQSSQPGGLLAAPLALFTTDDYLSWLENGVTSVCYWSMHQGFIDGGNGDNPLTPYYSVQLASRTFSTGDEMLATTSTNPLLRVHAGKRTVGGIGLILENEDPSNACTVSVEIDGDTALAKTAKVTSLGVANYSSSTLTYPSTLPTTQKVKLGGSSFTVTVPAYTENAYIIPAN
jgi:hypothetical protein